MATEEINQCLEIEIPLPMPTWNRILAMQHFERMKLRDLLHEFVSLSITYGSDWPTSTDYQGKRQSTDLLKLEYLQTIRPNKSRKCVISKLKASLKEQS
jgi:hypothetical protein